MSPAPGRRDTNLLAASAAKGTAAVVVDAVAKKPVAEGTAVDG